MGKKPLTFAQRLEKTLEKQRRRQEENFEIYAKACEEQGVAVGEPINIMALAGKKKEKR